MACSTVILMFGIIFWVYQVSAVIESCDSKIYCQGKLLDTVQRSKIFPDSKTFVDMIQKNHPDVTLKKFDDFMSKYNDKPTRADLTTFVNENFKSEGELENWIPHDYSESPAFLDKIKDPQIKLFAKNLTRIWPKLGRKVKQEVFDNVDRHSFIPVPNGFMIPGGRFKEIYYWDTFWIIKGLLISEMKESVRGILDNFISIVRKYGFVPNGSRVYYLNRSQPPLLSLMAGIYMDATNDTSWLTKNIDALETEVNWWTENRKVIVKKEGIHYQMLQYNVASGTPRPESYDEDVKTCAAYTNASQKEYCYKALKSGAESGWDFSSRWIFDNSGAYRLKYIDTTRVVPVDLNAFFCRALMEISRFHQILGNEVNATSWLEKAHWCQYCIRKVLYNEQDGIWYDYDLGKQEHRKSFYPSNFAPLWAKTYHPKLQIWYGKKAAEYIQNKDILKYHGGVPTSLFNTAEQWDLPNAWPPLQEIVILGLYNTGEESAKEIAETLANRWIDANIRGYLHSKTMYEKYDAEHPGVYGGGGEYDVQEGFGWSNGVALSLINQFAGGAGVMSSKYLIAISSALVFYCYGSKFKIYL